MNVGEKIRTIRKFKKLTQIDVAQKARIAVNSLRLYESGKRTPNLDQLKAIAEAMDSSLGDLLDEGDQKIFYAGADEGEDATEWAHRVISGYSFSKPEHFLISAFSTLNDEGQQKAVERVVELTEIPKYGKHWGKEITDKITCPMSQINEYTAKGYEVSSIQYFENGTGEGTATMVKVTPSDASQSSGTIASENPPESAPEDAENK